MSSTRRHDLAEEGRPVTDDSQTFKKAFQTADRPPTTDNINDQYFLDPPNNQPTGLAAGWSTQSAKEGAFENTDPKREGVLGDQAIGKQTKEAALGEVVTENTVHSGMSGA